MMDEEDGNSQTPPEKFFTISLEPINETPIIKVNHDGIEEIKKYVFYLSTSRNLYLKKKKEKWI